MKRCSKFLSRIGIHSKVRMRVIMRPYHLVYSGRKVVMRFRTIRPTRAWLENRIVRGKHRFNWATCSNNGDTYEPKNHATYADQR